MRSFQSSLQVQLQLRTLISLLPLYLNISSVLDIFHTSLFILQLHLPHCFAHQILRFEHSQQHNKPPPFHPSQLCTHFFNYNYSFILVVASVQRLTTTPCSLFLTAVLQRLFCNHLLLTTISGKPFSTQKTTQICTYTSIVTILSMIVAGASSLSV